MIWIQYSIIDGKPSGTLSVPITGSDYDALKANGFDQLEYPHEPDGDLSQYQVDITQNPPVLIMKSE